MDDVALGTPCVLDTRPEADIDDADVELLFDLAALVLVSVRRTEVLI